jgi:hypothetical protein
MLRFVSRKAFVIPTVALAVLAMMPAVSHAGAKAGDWILQLEGAGANNKEFNTGDVAAQASVGYFLTDQAELSLRQAAGYAFAKNGGSSALAADASILNPTAANGNTFTGATQLAFDWNIAMGNWVPFIGANVGLAYGDNHTKTVWEAGPEAGVKYYVNQTTYIYVEAEWDFTFASHMPGNSEFLYALGLGVKIN